LFRNPHALPTSKRGFVESIGVIRDRDQHAWDSPSRQATNAIDRDLVAAQIEIHEINLSGAANKQHG
jgi:hypothetical protein